MLYCGAVLSAKFWKPDAVLRLLLSVVLCMFAGSVAASVWQYVSAAAKERGLFFWILSVGSLLSLGAALVLVNRRWRFETMLRRMVALLALFYVGMFAGAWAQKLAGPGGNSVAQMIIAALSFQGAAVLLITLFLRQHQMSWAEAFGFPNHWIRAVLLGLVMAVLFLPVGWGLQQLSALLLSHFSALGIHPQEQQAVQTLRVATGAIDRATLGVITILLAPLAEETLFRGILYAWIKEAGFPRLALWGSSLLFALVHLNVVTFLPLLALALILARLYEGTNNLLASMATHGLFNGLNFAMLYLLDRRPT